MPLPAALLARLAKRGIVNSGKGEKWFDLRSLNDESEIYIF